MLTAYITAANSDWVKVQPLLSFVAKTPEMTIKTAPKKYEYAVRDRLEGYFTKIGAWNINTWKKRMETSGHIDAFEQVSEYKNERQITNGRVKCKYAA
jgi:hypothetical protein